MKIIPEPDRLDARVPLGILAVSIVVLVLSGGLTLGVYALARSADATQARNTGSSASAVAASSPRPTVRSEPTGAGRSGLFDKHLGPVSTREPPERLSGYGWVDRERGLVHIPIDRAKQLYLSREAGATVPALQRVTGSER